MEGGLCKYNQEDFLLDLNLNYGHQMNNSEEYYVSQSKEIQFILHHTNN